MGSDLANPKTWVPYHTNSKDCSQEKLCTVNCPQGCNNNRFFLTPPPALPFSSFSSSSSSPSPVGLTFSPLVIAIIGILASAFLLISYYAIITTYCGNTSSTATRGRRRRSSMIIRPHDYGVEFSSYHPSSRTEEPWYNYNNTRNSGLDEAVIKSFATFKVGERTVNNNNNGRSGGQEEEYCCVCLGEFEMGERLRLLPKCDHAFHLVCIDTWLKSHSNCPLCRAGIVLTPCTTTTMSDQVAGTHEATVCDQQTRNLDLVAEPSSSSSSMEGQQLVESSRNTDTVVVITEERDLEDGLGTTTTTPGTMNYSVRRSFSMDHVRGGRRLCGVSVGEILSRSNREMEEDEVWSELQQGVDMIGSDSRLLQPQEESSSSSGSVCEAKSKVLISCSVASIKRSFSSGRFSVPCCTCSSNGRGRQSVVPL